MLSLTLFEVGSYWLRGNFAGVVDTNTNDLDPEWWQAGRVGDDCLLLHLA